MTLGGKGEEKQITKMSSLVVGFFFEPDTINLMVFVLRRHCAFEEPRALLALSNISITQSIDEFIRLHQNRAALMCVCVCVSVTLLNRP